MSGTLLARLLLPAALAFVTGPEGPTGEPPAPTAAQEAGDGVAPAEMPEPGSAPSATHFVLPCGLRVVAAHDASLPVASVVLAVEVGTENDPEDNPGLVHALAFHLQQGNRELAPGELLATAHDVGGLGSMAVGHAQVRYETLVPVSQLDRVLWAESQRLRAPTVNPTLWLKTLNYARSDRRPRAPVPPEVLGAAWQRDGLTHDGHLVSKQLTNMTAAEVAAALTHTFEYRRSTLVIVSPRDPRAIARQVTALFADLPDAPREAHPSLVPAANEQGPRLAEAARQRGDTLVWPVIPTPPAKAWAEVVCATLNRQRRGETDGPKSRLRCTYIADARRPVLAVRATGADPVTLAAARLARIRSGTDDDILRAQRDRLQRHLRHQFHTPLNLARQLAQTDPSLATRALAQASIETLIGLSALDDLRGAERFVGSVFDTASATLLMPEKTPEKTLEKTPEKTLEKTPAEGTW